MALTHTPLCDTSFSAPDFSLKGVDGKAYTLEDVKGENGTLVMFICNHCPYVKAIITQLVQDAKALQENGIGVIAIMPNDTANYPDDSFENMQIFAKEHGFTFPYVIDEKQDVAHAYHAVCTPDFFGFNKDLELHYRGRLDDVTPSRAATAETKRELLDGMLKIAETGQGPEHQTASMGCSIKWRNEDAA